LSLLCLVQVRNEARFLPGFLHHIAPHVDGIVALDDGSTDATPDILRREPRIASILRETAPGPPHATETTNRYRLLVEAARLGARWVVCADADERFEERFLTRLRHEAQRGDMRREPVRLVRLVNLWDGLDQYRVDGLCGPRMTARMFRLPLEITPRRPGMHQPWFPPELDAAPRAVMDANLYHLRMVDRRDREARYRKFVTIDPDGRDQAIGYGHLIDERGLKLERIPQGRHFVDRAVASEPDWPEPEAPTGLLADAAFVERFHLAGPSRGPMAAPAAGAPHEWSHLTGFDFEAIFRGVSR